MGNTKSEKLNGTRAVVYCAFFVAVMVVLSQVSILLPFSPIPFTLGLFAVLMTGCFCGPLLGTAAVGVYIAMGAVGLPVFAAFGSTGALVGPTGGYIVGYLPMAFLAGQSARLNKKSKPLFFAGLALSVMSCYLLGTIWYAAYADINLVSAFMLCVVPFVLFDGVKVVLAAVVYQRVRRTRRG